MTDKNRFRLIRIISGLSLVFSAVLIAGCPASDDETLNINVNQNNSNSVASVEENKNTDNKITDEANSSNTEKKPSAEKSPSEVKGDFSHIKGKYATVLKQWIAKNNGWEPAVKSDSDGRFPPNAHPYYVAGDFNKDGKEDFAVGLVKSKDRKKLAFAVFNAPFKDNKPAFFTDKTESSDILILIEGNELLIGTYESDDGYRLSPKGDKYEVQMLGDEMP